MAGLPRTLAQIDHNHDIHPDWEFSFFDEENPRALINIVPESWKKYIKAIPAKYFEMGEQKLENAVEPTANTCRLRMRFWDEYQRAQDNVKMIQGSRVYYGIVPKEWFERTYLANPEALAWIMLPPKNYIVAMQEILDKGFDRFREIVRYPITQKIPVFSSGKPVFDENGKMVFKEVPNTAVMKEIVHIVELILNRVQGAVVQKLAIKQQTETITLQGDPLANASMETLEALESRLASVTNLLEGVSKKTEVIDGEAQEASSEGK